MTDISQIHSDNPELLENNPELAKVLGIKQCPPEGKIKGREGITKGKDTMPITHNNSPYTRNIVTVRVPYIGAVLTANHYKYRGGIHTRKEVKAWMQALGYELNINHLNWQSLTLPLHIICDGVFNDKRHPDLSNLAKVVLDAIQDASGINDKNMRWHDGDVFYGSKPELIITIKDVRI